MFLSWSNRKHVSFPGSQKKSWLIPSRHTWTSAALGWDASHASLYTIHYLYTFLLKTRSITHHRYQRVQMLISLTSVGVQDRSASLAPHFGSLVLLWCWTCCRLDSSRDSICSWHARKQSCKTQFKINKCDNHFMLECHTVLECVCIPGHCQWPVIAGLWGSERKMRHRGSSDRDPVQLLLRCLLQPLMEDLQ